eukprot:XP_011676065.1 PREDICTED: uncharacterized protein LOC105444018 [Strongylocentrotus purpuratus]
MASRPFNTSAKEPVSVKLRGLNASKSVTRQLEIDSRRMEERLRELKVVMNREKQERERQGSAGSGGIWSSAKTAPPGIDVTKKKSPAKPTKPGENKIRKIKVLKDTPIELPKRAPKKYPPAPNSVRKSFSGPPCGQCEERAVALVNDPLAWCGLCHDDSAWLIWKTVYSQMLVLREHDGVARLHCLRQLNWLHTTEEEEAEKADRRRRRTEKEK